MSVPQYDPPPRSSGGSTLLVIALVILIVIVVACGGLCGGCYFLGRQAANRAGEALESLAENLPLLQAMTAAQVAVMSDAQVIDRLGEPVTLTSMPARQGQGPLNPRGETLQFDIEGPKGKAIASAVATAEGNNYRLQKIAVTFSDGSVVDVPVPEDGGIGEPLSPPEDAGAIPLDPELNSPIEPPPQAP
jgi:hypothetical protein